MGDGFTHFSGLLCSTAPRNILLPPPIQPLDSFFSLWIASSCSWKAISARQGVTAPDDTISCSTLTTTPLNFCWRTSARLAQPFSQALVFQEQEGRCSWQLGKAAPHGKVFYFRGSMWPLPNLYELLHSNVLRKLCTLNPLLSRERSSPHRCSFSSAGNTFFSITPKASPMFASQLCYTTKLNYMSESVQSIGKRGKIKTLNRSRMPAGCFHAGWTSERSRALSW